MISPPFSVIPTETFLNTVISLATSPQHRARLKKIRKAQYLLEQIGPDHSGLQTHPIKDRRGPNGEPVLQSYIENKTPSAWRLWWVYGPNQGEITLLDVGPHP